MKKIYKIIPSFPNFEICDTESLDKCVRIVKTKEYCRVRLNGSGYPRVFLRKSLGGYGKEYFLHVLVCETYIGKIPEGMVCDHIDTNKLNINHNNLKICTIKENNNNPLTRKHNSKVQMIVHDHQKKWVQQIDKNSGNIINEYFGVKDASRKTGFYVTGISSCCNRRLKTYKGFIWKYKEQY